MDRLRQLREERQEKQDDIANAMGTQQGMVSKWENGAVQPDIDMLIKLARYFGVSIDYLVGCSDTRDPVTLRSETFLHEYMNRKFGREYTNQDIDTIDKILELVEKYKT